MSNNIKTGNKRKLKEDRQHQAYPQEQPPREIGGPKGLEPTRYGDWERRGRCIDF